MTTATAPTQPKTAGPFNPALKIYKPNINKPDYGAASSWEWNPKTGNFFLTIAKQASAKSESGKPTFAWKEQAEIFKLGEWDLGDIVNVLRGRKDFLGQPDEGGDSAQKKGKGLFHQVTKGENAILKIYKVDKSNDLGLELSTSKNGVRFWAGHRISQAEATVLALVLEDVIKRMFYFTQ